MNLKSSEDTKKANKFSLLNTVGSEGRKLGEFVNPQDVALNSLGKLYATDSNNRSVQIFQLSNPIKSEGCGKEPKFINKFEMKTEVDLLVKAFKGTKSRRAARPTGLCLLPSGDVAVSDFDNKVVDIFSSDGKYKSSIVGGGLMGPRGVCTGKNDDIIVVDSKACQIFVYSSDGKFVKKFGGRGTGKEQLGGPQYAAVNEQREILVTDFYNHCVKIFDKDGIYIRTFGSEGKGPGQFNAPTGIFVGQHGNVIVADWGNNRIQVFDENYCFLSYIISKSNPLFGPQGVAIEKNFVVVADPGNKNLKVYDAGVDL